MHSSVSVYTISAPEAFTAPGAFIIPRITIRILPYIHRQLPIVAHTIGSRFVAMGFLPRRGERSFLRSL